MKKFSKNEKILLAVAGIAVVGAFFSFGGFQFSINPATSLAGQIQLKKKKIIDAWNLLDEKEKIKEESNRYAQYDLTASAEDYTPQLLKELEAIAGTAQVQVINISSVPTNTKSDSVEYLSELEVEATLAQLAAFLFAIQESKNFLTVTKFRVNPNPDKPDFLKIYLTVSKSAIL